MSVYTNPPEWEAQGKKPPSFKRTEGWKPGDRVPASWLNWFWFSTVNSLREIAQAFVNHRDASAPHDGHETKEGATAKVEAHSQKTTAVHGVGQHYVAKTSRSDQWPSWSDIPDKPSSFPPGPHQHSAQDIVTGTFDVARIPNLPASKITSGTFDAARLPQASTSQAGIVQLTNSRSSTSETLAVTAKALNDHRSSGDHDERYYTKSQLSTSGGGGAVHWDNITNKPNLISLNILRDMLMQRWMTLPSGTSTDLYDIAYGNGLWVVVGNNGIIRTSTDGISWTSRASGPSMDLYGVAYGNGLWVAVGENGRIMTSTDGASWTIRIGGSTNYSSLQSVAYGNGLWVAVGNDGAIETSTNGASWASRSSGTRNDLRGVAYSNGLWVVVGAAGTILTSTDGISWTVRFPGSANSASLQSVAYGNGLWVAVGANGAIRTSTDGISWTSRSSGTSASLYGVAYSNGFWVAVGTGGTIRTSKNGTSWTSSFSGTSNTLRSVAYGNNLWFAAGDSGTISNTYDIGA